MQQATDQTEASLVLSTHDELNAFAQNMRQQARFDYFNLKTHVAESLHWKVSLNALLVVDLVDKSFSPLHQLGNLKAH